MEESNLMENSGLTATQMEAQLTRLLDWGNAAGSRLALVLPLSTAMLGALALIAPLPCQWSVVAAISSAFATFFLTLSIIFSAVASFPRTTGPKGSLIYFGGIITRDLSQYENEVKSLTPKQYLDDLIQQCHRNAQITERKYAWVQRSMACLFFAALPWVIALFTLYSAKP